MLIRRIHNNGVPPSFSFSATPRCVALLRREARVLPVFEFCPGSDAGFGFRFSCESRIPSLTPPHALSNQEGAGDGNAFHLGSMHKTLPFSLRREKMCRCSKRLIRRLVATVCYLRFAGEAAKRICDLIQFDDAGCQHISDPDRTRSSPQVDGESLLFRR